VDADGVEHRYNRTRTLGLKSEMTKDEAKRKPRDIIDRETSQSGTIRPSQDVTFEWFHDADVIRAKAPGLWNAAVQKLKADCERCAATFPNDGQRNPVLIKKPNGFALQNSDFPRRIYSAELRVEGYLVKVMKMTQPSISLALFVSSGSNHEDIDFATLIWPHL
jgi:hypothetical protein